MVLLLLLCAGTSAALAADATVARLENGLRVVLIEIHGSPMIASTVIVGAGADRETASTAGASHMLEHLLFNGTERRTQKELYDETDFYGIYSNATTRRSHTVYFVLASSEHIARAIDIQEDMLFHSTVPVEKFEKERGIVIEEIGKDEQNIALIADRLFRTGAFRGSPYGREVLGTRETIRALSRDDAFAYYRATYVPNNMTLLLTGDFDTDEMLALVRAEFGANQGRPVVQAVIADAPPLPEHPDATVYHSPVDNGHLSIAFPAPPLRSPDGHTFSLLTELLGERLQERLVLAETPPLLSIDCSYERRRSFGRLIVSCTFESSREPAAIENHIVDEMNRFAGEGVDADRLARFVVSRKTADIYLSEKLHYYGMMMAAEYALIGREGLDEKRALLENADSGMLSDAAGALVQTDRRLSVALAPGEKDYDAKDFHVQVDGEKNPWEVAAGKRFTPGTFEIVRRAAVSAGEAGREDPEAADRRAFVDTTLENGMRLLIDSNDDSEVFAVHLLMKNRSWREPEGKGGIADFVHRLLPRGTTARSAAELRTALESIGAELKVGDASYIPYDDYYTTPEYSYIRFTTIDEFAAEGIALLSEMVTSPRFAAGDVEAVRGEKLAAAKGKGETPSNLSRTVLRSHLYRGHPLQSPPEGSEASIRKISRKDASRFHADYFTTDNMIVSVVTSLPVKEVAQKIEERFAPLARSTRPVEEPPKVGVTAADKLFSLEQGVTQAYIRTGYTVHVPPADRAPLQVALSLLSSDLAFDLRETRGLAYSIGAGVTFSGETAAISAAMGTSPENIDEALQGIRAYLGRKLSRDDVDNNDVARTVNSLIGRGLMRRLSRPNQAYRLGLRAFHDDPTDPVAALREVSAEDVIRVSDLYIRSAPAATVIVR